MNLIQRYAHEFAPTGEMIASTVHTGGGVASDTFLGATTEVVTGATVHYEYTFSGNQIWDSIIVEVDNPAHIDSTEFPLIRRDGGFTGLKIVTLNNGRAKTSYSLNFADEVGASATTITGTETGSYYEYSETAVIALLSSGGQKSIYSGSNRNGSSWWPHSELTGIPYSNTASGSAKRGGVLITSRHMLFAQHYPVRVGDSVAFKKADGTNVTAIVAGTAHVDVSTAAFSDLAVATFATAVDPDIIPLPLVGPWITNLSGSDCAFQFVGIWQDQNRDANFVDVGCWEYKRSFPSSETWRGIDLSSLLPSYIRFTSAGITSELLPSLHSYRASHKTYGGSGDSGSAVLVPVTGGWAVAGCMRSWGACPFPHATILNKLIELADTDAGISTGYTVTVAPDPTL